MKLVDILKESYILRSLPDAGKEVVLEQMLGAVSAELTGMDHAEVLEQVLERERRHSTGIGSGIAIPHARFEKLDRHIIAFGRSVEGVDFDAIDHEPVHLIFLVLGPIGANEQHLQLLARISKFLHDTRFRDLLLAAPSEKDIYDVIAEKDAAY